MIDMIGAAAGLALAGPVMAVIAFLIVRDSPGPAVFRQRRIGRNGELFTFYKFRSMRPDADPYGHSPNRHDDPRITRIGAFLRRTSLDELPQLFNVLQGQMTLVGPRPLLPWQYERWTPRQRRRCRVKPGLTGWAQVNGRGALTHEDKIELDLWYVDHRSAALDLRIIAATVVQAVRGQDILERQYSRTDTGQAASRPTMQCPDDA